ncbi:NADP-dependent oxidoreductase domain superfamily protein [Pleurotus pulmonarius]
MSAWVLFPAEVSPLPHPSTCGRPPTCLGTASSSTTVEAGKAIRESGLAREEIYVTTKYSGLDGLDIETSIQNSLANLGISYVDLYLIHHPRLATPDIPTAWAKMEALQKKGFAKSIGVSNFGVEDLKILLASAKIKPVANQILWHPYVYAQQAPILEFSKQNGIVIEGYSTLIPITRSPGGPVDKPLSEIAERLDATPDQILLAWAKAKGVVVVTTSSKESRLKGYQRAGDLKLTAADISAIDNAGAEGAKRSTARVFIRRAALATLAVAMALRVLTVKHSTLEPVEVAVSAVTRCPSGGLSEPLRTAAARTKGFKYPAPAAQVD